MTEVPEPVDTFQLLRAHPNDPPNIRMLRFSVIGMGALLLAGLTVVIGRIAYLSTRPVGTSVTAPVEAPGTVARSLAVSSTLAADIRLALPQGAKVRSQSLDGNRLAVHYDATTGEGILILDLETGRPLSQIRIEPSNK